MEENKSKEIRTTMNLVPFLIICPLTFLAGLVDSIAGGGGLISLPAFLLSGLPAHIAIGSNKLSSAIGTTVSTTRYCKNGYFHKKLALPTILAALAGSAIGARLVLFTSDAVLKKMMLVALPIVAICVLTDKKKVEETFSSPEGKTFFFLVLGAFIIGMYDGFYGPGTGTFLFLILTRIGHMDAKTASGNVKLINLSSNIAALSTFLINGNVHIIYGLAGAVFCLTGHYIGSGLVMKNGMKVIRPIVIVVLILLFIKLLSGQ